MKCLRRKILPVTVDEGLLLLDAFDEFDKSDDVTVCVVVADAGADADAVWLDRWQLELLASEPDDNRLLQLSDGTEQLMPSFVMAHPTAYTKNQDDVAF